jgi:hypothetical protein
LVVFDRYTTRSRGVQWQLGQLRYLLSYTTVHHWRTVYPCCCCQPFLPDTIKARVQGTQNFKRFLSLRLGVWGVLSRSRGSLALCMHIIESCLLLCRLHCFILCDSATFGNCKRGHCMGYHPDEVIYVLKWSSCWEWATTLRP